MCGIWGWFGKTSCPAIERYLNFLKGRGPEDMKYHTFDSVGTLGFTRLAINGLTDAGMQPFHSNGISWICNGEIYNSKSLSEQFQIPMPSGSDCEILGPLYTLFRDRNDLQGFFRALDGVFAIAIYDETRGELVVGRDPYGVRPLFAGYVCIPPELKTDSFYTLSTELQSLTFAMAVQDIDKFAFCFASERKALANICPVIVPFTPGHFMTIKVPTLDNFYMGSYHTTPWIKNNVYINYADFAKISLYQNLRLAVQKRMMTERPVGALLSGGVDSSLIASLVQRELHEYAEKTKTTPKKLQTFSIGMNGSSDLFYAKKVADFIGSEHHEIILTPDDFFNAIPQVIKDIESFDITTVRASVGNWLVSKYIRENTDCKVIFNGDGSDELNGSYLYFYNAPDDNAFEQEVCRLLDEIHYYDVLRSDRSISSHGLEPRTPFLDKQFVATALSLPTHLRRPIRGTRMEKQLLREAFDDGTWLPKEVLWRQKEAFSDGVSSKEKSWFEEIQERVTHLVPADWQEKAKQFSYLPPQTPESYYYRILFEESYGPTACYSTIPAFWMPKWSPETKDPSARTLRVYS